jgi:hypothetical protein
MKSFDFYEFAGVLAPGAVVLLALHLLAPGMLGVSLATISAGSLGVLTVFAYVAGHLTQALGNMVDKAWWAIAGGIPSDWIRTRPNKLLADQQIALLPQKLETILGLGAAPDVAKLSKAEWAGLTRQVYAAIAAAQRAQRIDTFNGSYGLNRGIGSAFLVLAAVTLIRDSSQWFAALFWTGLAFMALTRMHRFGKHYARELAVQFLQLPTPKKEA